MLIPRQLTVYSKAMKKPFILLLFSLFAFISNGQTGKEIKFSIGVNQSILSTDVTSPGLLSDGSVASGWAISSQDGPGFNLGLTGAFSISKNENWKLRTGINFQTLRFNTLSGGVGQNKEYRFLFEHKLNQIDLPLLLSYEKEKGKFSFGGDAGLIKGIVVWGEVSSLSYEISQNEEIDIYKGAKEPMGFVGLGDKFSLYAAPSMRYAISETIKLEIQPFYRYQFGDKSSYKYSNKEGAPMSQYGLNLGIVKRF